MYLFQLFFVLLLYCAATSFATSFTVHNPHDFVTLVDKSANGDFNYDIVLLTDLDFSDPDLVDVVDKLPLGSKNNSECTPYSGTFDGNGRSVKNLRLTNKLYSGLICETSNAVIKNLVIYATCVFSGDIVGSVVVTSSGSLTIDNVNVHGIMDGKNISGGIIGQVKDVLSGSIIVQGSGFHGTIVHYETICSSALSGGGFIGYVTSCVNCNLKVLNNLNDGNVNTAFNQSFNKVGGYVGHITDCVSMNITVSGNENNVKMMGVVDSSSPLSFGGLFGYIHGTLLRVMMEDNVNKAVIDVTSSGDVEVGGYVGYLSVVNGFLMFKKNCYDGVMKLGIRGSGWNVSGFVGGHRDDQISDITFESNTNNGDIYFESPLDTPSCFFGGFLGFYSARVTRVFSFFNNTNNGCMDGNASSASSDLWFFGGFVGEIYALQQQMVLFEIPFKSNTNNGNITVSGTQTVYISSFVGYLYMTRSGVVYFDNNVNTGEIETRLGTGSHTCYIGCVVAYLSSGFDSDQDRIQIYFMGNINRGTIRLSSSNSYYVGGIVGYSYLYSSAFAIFNGNINSGDITVGAASSFSSSFVGGIAAYLDSSHSYPCSIQFTNNSNHGNMGIFSNSYFYVGGLVGQYKEAGYNYLSICNNTNNGGITVQQSNSHYSYSCYAGGSFGVLNLECKKGGTHIFNNINNGIIVITVHSSSSPFAGGFVGSFSMNNYDEFLFYGNINNGGIDVTLNYGSSSSGYVGGLIAYVNLYYSGSFRFYENKNNAKMTAKTNSSNAYSWYIGGFSAYLYSTSSAEILFYDNVNDNDLEAFGNSPRFIGGFFGYSSMTGSDELDLHGNINRGSILSVGAYTSSTSSYSSYLGGIAGNIIMTCYSGIVRFNGNINKGQIDTQTSSVCQFFDTFYVGGIAGYCSFPSFKECYSNGNTNEGSLRSVGPSHYYYGGVFGSLDCSSAKDLFVTDLCNNGQLNVESSSKESSYSCTSYVGGIIGYCYLSSLNNTLFQSITNKGNIQLAGYSHSYIGGFAGSFYSSAKGVSLLHGINNSGIINAKINITSSSNHIGGSIGYCSLQDSQEFRFYDNENDGNVDVEIVNGSQIASSGLLGYLSSMAKIFNLHDNVNHGSVNIIANSERVIHGGIVGLFSPSKSSVSVRAEKNRNGGNVAFDLKTYRSLDTQYSLGGLFGYFSPGMISLDIDNNFNSGSIEGTFKAGPLCVGGVVGGMQVPANASVIGNVNKASIAVSSSEMETDNYCFVGGIIGMFPNSSILKMMDNANYGDVTSHCVRKQIGTCGLLCSLGVDSNTTITIENSVNQGDIKGTMAYGISDYITSANNIVNLGDVSGTSQSYSFWRNAPVVVASRYGVDGDCKNCDKGVKLVRLDASDGQYHLVDDKSVFADAVLNDEAKKKGYYLRWDGRLHLGRLITIHIGSPVDRTLHVVDGFSMEEYSIPEEVFKYHLIPKGSSLKADNEYKKTTVIEDNVDLVPYYLITISGAMSESIYIEANGKHNLADASDKLKEYLKSKDYAIGDLDTNTLLSGNPAINENMNVTVMRRNMVIIEMEGQSVLAVDVNPAKIAEEVSVLTGISTDNILVDIVSDDNGYVLRIILVLKDFEMSNDVVLAINNLVKDATCHAGVLCRSREARVVIEGQSISIGDHSSGIHIVSLLCSVFIAITVNL